MIDVRSIFEGLLVVDVLPPPPLLEDDDAVFATEDATVGGGGGASSRLRTFLPFVELCVVDLLVDTNFDFALSVVEDCFLVRSLSFETLVAILGRSVGRLEGEEARCC